MKLTPGQSLVAAIIGIIIILIFFSSVNLTQNQAVTAMFVCLGTAAGFWFWLKPWK
ncbi:hypothetical protein HYR69_09255 [Candidatus Sumerlaeota bacterium]|nr:hypothetical protein [Candidatus Sumerlaeota bacterium]MBI3735788.1 hypothetical protein [Candidatus Sumerlaeota bacterium]